MCNWKVINALIFLCVALSSATADEDHDTLKHEPDGISGWISGTDKMSGHPKKMYFGRDGTQNDIHVRDMKDISVHCEANFPVELDYSGNPTFRFHNTGQGSSSSSFSNGTHSLDVERHMMYAFLPTDCGECTGIYICKSIDASHGKKVSSHIYFPTKHLFASTRSAPVSSDKDPFIIPCAIAEPNATVTLLRQNSEDGVKFANFEKYDPLRGFFVRKSENNTEGSFFCVADFNGTRNAVPYSVMKGEVTCSKLCYENSDCTEVNEQEECVCKPGYEKALVSERCLKPCKTDNNCDQDMACLIQDASSFFLDLLLSIDGKKDAIEEEGERGHCKNPCVHTNTKCTNEEECHVVNHKPICRPSK